MTTADTRDMLLHDFKLARGADLDTIYALADAWAAYVAQLKEAEFQFEKTRALLETSAEEVAELVEKLPGRSLRWWPLPCGCEASHDALIIAKSCQIHRRLVPADGLFIEGQYGPIQVPAATGA